MSLNKIRNFASQIGIRWRLTLLFVFVFGVGMGSFVFLQHRMTTRYLSEEFDMSLYNYAVDISELITLDKSVDRNNPAFLDHDRLYPFSYGSALIQVRDSSGVILNRYGPFGQFELPVPKVLPQSGDEATYATLTNLKGLENPEAKSYRMVTFPLDASAQFILEIAAPLSFLEGQQAETFWFLKMMVPAVLIFSTLCGYLLSLRALKPIEEMSRAASEISSENLSTRLNVPVAKDELHHLAITMNSMLDRIHLSFQAQERFVADASHQLLTPLAILKNEIESIQKNQSGDIQNLKPEIEDLISLVKNLLILTRVDSGIQTLQKESLSIEDVLSTAIRKVEKVAKEKNIRFRFNLLQIDGESFPLKADEGLLGVLFFNLLENAVKYSPTETTVDVVLKWQQDFAEVEILDQGPGLANLSSEHLFERFRRGPTTNHIQGHGLGLSIVTKISELHGFSVKAETRPDGGSRFTVQIKKN